MFKESYFIFWLSKILLYNRRTVKMMNIALFFHFLWKKKIFDVHQWGDLIKEKTAMVNSDNL